MIQVIENFLNEEQCKAILGLSNNSETQFLSDKTLTAFFQYFKKINDDYIDINILKNLETNLPLFKNCHFKYLRLQFTDETIIQTDVFHKHLNPYSFVIYLNNEFSGGELEFENGKIVFPKMGTMVYFTQNESHRVKNCIGKRWCLVGFLNNDMFKPLIKKML